jgi:N-acyl-D-amino-acid deacylase
VDKGKSKEMLAIVDDARQKGFDVTFDAHCYVVLSTTLISMLARWVHEGGPDAILERLRDPKTKEKVCADMRASNPYAWNRLVLACASMKKNKVYIGKSLLEGAETAGKEVTEFTCDLLLEEDLNASYVNFSGSEEDMRVIMKHPCHMACSDGLLVGDKPNPRGWGTFPRFLGVYSRELGILRLEEIIRHMTSAPAQCLRLNDRGLVKEGLAGDLVVFDPKTIKDMATIDEPKKSPVGIDYVFVNGALVVDKGKHTGVLNGRALVKGSLVSRA